MTLVALLEATVLPHLQVGGAQPDLALLTVGAWTLQHGSENGALWATVGGLGLDLLSAGPFGASALGLLAVCALVGGDQGRPFRSNPLAMIFGVVVMTLVFHGVVLTLMQLTGHQVSWLDAGWQVILPRAAFNLTLMPFVYGLLRWLDRSGRWEGVLE